MDCLKTVPINSCDFEISLLEQFINLIHTMAHKLGRPEDTCMYVVVFLSSL